ncbi:hypothetical protein LMH87_004072 [Akanthomyces muscarius]|uniref:Alcohol dehydrogenase-like N-terminal domain-containing protein n=1 Tax=Akanthomyces muscarius TaxID=2231603 RepID=A0A9W8Q4X2_AKAMU|nr:hypothetical protein LMH87_004072 [Akanthomyces muscarius]KAJ4145217.1 hypothetical protein LMH87_004072 [Akanthomyces muscarius]
MALNRNENQAAWLMGANERLKVDSIQNWTPGPGQNPKFNMLQLQFPAMLGSAYAGIVTEIAPGVTSVACGDRVAVARWGATTCEERFTSFQKYPLALERNVLKLGTESLRRRCWCHC